MIQVTEMLSFYALPSTIIGNKTYPTLRAAYAFYNVANTVRSLLFFFLYSVSLRFFTTLPTQYVRCTFFLIIFFSDLVLFVFCFYALVNECVCLSVCLSVCLGMCVCVHVCVYVCMYVYRYR